jgi:hypothetical protein
MTKLITPIAMFGVIALLAYPFARDAYTRHQMMSRLGPVMTEQDREAFRSWNGDATSFAEALLDRCKLANGPDAATCAPYRVALDR